MAAPTFPMNTGNMVGGRPVYQAPQPLTYQEFLAMQGIQPQQAATVPQKSVTDQAIETLLKRAGGSETASATPVAAKAAESALANQGLAASAEANAAYNAAAMEASGAPMTLPEVALAEPTSTLSSIMGYAIPAAAIAYGGKAVYDFAKGKKLDPVQKAAMAIPTAGASLFSDKLQKKFGIGQNRTGKNQEKKLSELVESGLIPKNMPGVSEGIIQDKGHGDKELYSGKMKGKDVWGVSGMYDTFKGDWLGKYSENQRERIAQRLLDERLLDSKDGLTRVTNEERARQIAEEEFLNKAAPQGAAINPFPQSTAVMRPTANMIPRSKTLSPGIGLDGKPTSWRK